MTLISCAIWRYGGKTRNITFPDWLDYYYVTCSFCVIEGDFVAAYRY